MHPHLRRALGACALLAALAPATAAAAPEPSASRLDDRILDPAARGNVTFENTANIASYQQDGLLTYKGWQYTGLVPSRPHGGDLAAQAARRPLAEHRARLQAVLRRLAQHGRDGGHALRRADPPRLSDALERDPLRAQRARRGELARPRRLVVGLVRAHPRDDPRRPGRARELHLSAVRDGPRPDAAHLPRRQHRQRPPGAVPLRRQRRRDVDVPRALHRQRRHLHEPVRDEHEPLRLPARIQRQPGHGRPRDLVLVARAVARLVLAERAGQPRPRLRAQPRRRHDVAQQRRGADRHDRARRQRPDRGERPARRGPDPDQHRADQPGDAGVRPRGPAARRHQPVRRGRPRQARRLPHEHLQPARPVRAALSPLARGRRRVAHASSCRTTRVRRAGRSCCSTTTTRRT